MAEKKEEMKEHITISTENGVTSITDPNKGIAPIRTYTNIDQLMIANIELRRQTDLKIILAWLNTVTTPEIIQSWLSTLTKKLQKEAHAA